jgi:transposase-like protein
MRPISFKRHRFPADVIQLSVWLYFRFTVSFRDVEEMLAQRGVEVSYETIRCWTIKFGPLIARNLRRKRQAPPPRWRLDEVVSNIRGKRVYIWRAVDDEGEVLDLVVQKPRDTDAALKLLKRLLRNQQVEPEAIITDGLAFLLGRARRARASKPPPPSAIPSSGERTDGRQYVSVLSGIGGWAGAMVSSQLDSRPTRRRPRVLATRIDQRDGEHDWAVTPGGLTFSASGRTFRTNLSVVF